MSLPIVHVSAIVAVPPVQVYPHSTVQVEEHPSSGAVLPSSQASDAVRSESPQTSGLGVVVASTGVLVVVLGVGVGIAVVDEELVAGGDDEAELDTTGLSRI